MHLTTTQAADVIADGLAVNGRRPQINAAKIATLVDAAVLTDVSSTRRYMVDSAEAEAFINATRYVPDVTTLTGARPLFRASVHPRTDRGRHSYTVHGITYRYIGVTAEDSPVSANEIGGWCGVWRISDATEQTLINHNGLALASLRGYVLPGHIRAVIDTYTDPTISPRKFLITAPADRDFAGTGLWVDIPRGPVAGLLTPAG